MQKVQKCQLIELQIPANSTQRKFQFQDQPYLRGKKILGLEVLSTHDMEKSPTGFSLITPSMFQNSYLTLYSNEVTMNGNNAAGEWLQNIPFPVMHRIQNGSNEQFVRQTFDMAGQVIYWEKSYITLGNDPDNVATVSYLIQVYFTD